MRPLYQLAPGEKRHVPSQSKSRRPFQIPSFPKRRAPANEGDPERQIEKRGIAAWVLQYLRPVHHEREASAEAGAATGRRDGKGRRREEREAHLLERPQAGVIVQGFDESDSFVETDGDGRVWEHRLRTEGKTKRREGGGKVGWALRAT